MSLNAYLIYYSIVFVEEEEKNSISERTYIHTLYNDTYQNKQDKKN